MVILIVSSFAEASWKMSSEDVSFSKGVLKRTNLTFKGGGEVFNYLPREAPYLMTIRKKVLMDSGEVVFITGWSHGAQSTIFRVFAPGALRSTPVCELTSLSDEFEYKQEGAAVEIKILMSVTTEPKWTWSKCAWGEAEK